MCEVYIESLGMKLCSLKENCIGYIKIILVPTKYLYPAPYMYLSILLPFAIPFYNRSHLPAGTSGTAAAFDTSLLTPEVSGAGDESRPPPLYLPTAENRDAYKIIVVERKVVVPPPAEPVKDARTIELEVYVVELRGTNRRPYM